MSKVKNPNGYRNWGYTIELKKNKKKTDQKEKNELRQVVRSYNRGASGDA